VGYGPFYLCVIHKEDQCSSTGDINRLMMMMMMMTAICGGDINKKYCRNKSIQHKLQSTIQLHNVSRTKIVGKKKAISIIT
jgi:hypothetical protein